MKAIMLMFDSLNRHMLQPYGCEWTKTPNFNRLKQKTVMFENSYAGSLPCMPARREIHTGRYNFLHRSWGPMEPYDDSMPRLLKQNGVYSHLISDHHHYWEEGGANYHTKYSSWEIVRGQENDAWKANLTDDIIVPKDLKRGQEGQLRANWTNRSYMEEEKNQPLPRTMQLGMEFILKNHDVDSWFLQLETFSPHEPFFAPQKYKDLYKHDYDGPHFDWANYGEVKETEDEIAHLRLEYASILSMCDEYLGKILDQMDRYNMWEDTMLIVNTDHGFLLGEHNFTGKIQMPYFNEIAHTPLFVWDPRAGVSNVSRKSLVQTIDLAPTVLDFFDLSIPKNMIGKPLSKTIENDTKIREAALFGQLGGHVNCTNGTYVYMRAPKSKENQPIYNYTLMPTHITQSFSPQSLKDVTLVEPFEFTKGCKTMKIPYSGPFNVVYHTTDTLLYNVEVDQNQNEPLDDKEVEAYMVRHLVKLMRENDAPIEQYERLGLQDDH